MIYAIGSRFRTGERCVESGHYVRDGMVLGLLALRQRGDEQAIDADAGQPFPPDSAGLECWWRLVRRAGSDAGQSLTE